MRGPLAPAFDSGTIRGLMMLFRNTLFWDVGTDKGGPARTFHLGMAGAF